MFQDRQRQIQAQITQKLEDKKAKKEKTGGTKLNNNISISREISKYGGVWCKSEIETKLQELNKKVNPSKCVREALLCQIKFHKSVLNSKGPREHFQETFKKKNVQMMN